MKQKTGFLHRFLVPLTMAVFVLAALAVHAGYEYDLGEGNKVTFGADMRIRLSHWDRDTVSPEMRVYGRGQEFGPAWEYMRVRSRVWGSLMLGDDIQINARLVNRVHFVSSRPGENNDGPATWEFPDEVIVDQLNLQIKNIAGSDWSLTIGRQDLPLGLGMVFLEGTPYDQGRTIYFDGVSARYKTEKDDLKLFAFYNNYKDKFVFIDDQNRRLSRGDIFTTGAYWTRNFAKSLNTDLYYIYANVNDTRPGMGDFDGCERNFPWAGAPNSDADVLVHTAGIRLFGPLAESGEGLGVDYSVEYARQYGKRNHNDDMSGQMLDARLTLKAPEDIPLDPSLLLEYSYFSGDDPTSIDEMEGWDPLFAAYPIWREELLPILFNGNWTNMKQYRGELTIRLSECCTASAAYALLRAEYGELANAGGGGNGNTIGHLISAFIDWKPTKWLAFALEASEFLPNGYWYEHDNATWLRFQTTLTY